MVDESRGEHADLDDRDDEIGEGRRDERTRPAVLLAPAERLPGKDSERDERYADGQESDCSRLPRDRRRDVGKRVLLGLGEGRIGAEGLPVAADEEAADEPGHPGDSEGRERRHQPTERCGRAFGKAEHAQGEDEGGHEADGLEARREREADRAQQHDLVPERRVT